MALFYFCFFCRILVKNYYKIFLVNVLHYKIRTALGIKCRANVVQTALPNGAKKVTSSRAWQRESTPRAPL